MLKIFIYQNWTSSAVRRITRMIGFTFPQRIKWRYFCFGKVCVLKKDNITIHVFEVVHNILTLVLVSQASCINWTYRKVGYVKFLKIGSDDALLLYFVLLYTLLLYCTVLLYTVLLYTVLLYAGLLYTVLLCTVLLYIILLYTVLLYTVLLYALLCIIQGDSKNMSPLAFKSNTSRPMSRTTLPDTAFERGDNFLSNECIHTRFPFQIASSQAEHQKLSGFCVFRFRRTRKYDLSPLYRIWRSNLCMHVTAHVNIFLLKKKPKAEQLKLRSQHCRSARASPVPAGCLAIRQQSALYRDHVCLRYLKSEAWPSKSRDITWTS